MSQLLKSSGAMGLATMLSRVLGMGREMVYAWFMGDSWVAGAFTLAFMVPNLFRRLLGEGALTAAFIPIFKEKEKTSTAAEMWRASNAVLSALTVGALAIVAVGMLGITLVLLLDQTKVIHLRDGQTTLMLQLLRVMLPYVWLVCVAALCMGMLNARGHFFVPAMGATTLNVVMILSVLAGVSMIQGGREKQVFALAVGVVVAGVAQAAFQWPLLHREGFRAAWVSPWRDETVRRVVKQMIPGAIGVAAFQINVLITQGFAFRLDAGVVASFGYAVRLMELPQGVFGISLATFLLPALSGLAAEKKYPEFRATLRQGVGWLVFVNLLAGVLLLVLAEPMVRLIFERGQFNEASTDRAAQALQCLAPGLVAFSLVNILARAFYALGDTKTPMQISIFCLAVNVLLSLALLTPLRQAGLGVANTLSAVVNMALLFYALRRKLKTLELAALARTWPALLGVAIIAGAVAWGSARLWTTHLGHANVWLRLGEVFLPMSLATAAYLALAAWLKVPQLDELLALLKRRMK